MEIVEEYMECCKNRVNIEFATHRNKVITFYFLVEI